MAKTYDIAILHDHVYIGMENVAITYREKFEDALSFDDVTEKVKSSVAEWDNDPAVVNARNGRAGYYPSEHKAPCYILVADSELGVFAVPGQRFHQRIGKYDDVRRMFNRGALILKMSDGEKTCLQKLEEYARLREESVSRAM